MAQEKGFVNQNLEAVLSVELTTGAQIECVLDTGFNGKLLLPREFVEENSLTLIGTEPVIMIEGQTVTVEVVEAEIKWLGDEFLIDILVSETGDALIGTEMLIDAKLEIDYKDLSVKITK